MLNVFLNAAQPRSLAWGNANDPQMARSKRKFFELHEAARASLLRGAECRISLNVRFG